jgi:tetratricopeptide (TPR) repeat protein
LIHEQTGATASLQKRVEDPALNAILKAALLASVRTPTPESVAIARSQLSASEPLIRLGAVQIAGMLPLPQRRPLLIDLARDPARAVRLEVARLLAGTETSLLTAVQRDGLDAAIAEYRKALSQDDDRAESLTALAGLQMVENDPEAARASFEKALHQDDTSLVTLLNYADFDRAGGNDAEAERLLMHAVALYPDSADVHLAVGLLRVRQKRTAEAIPELARAAEISPNNSNYAYVYAVGLYSTGNVDAAFSVLETARARFPTNAEIQGALQAYCADQKQNGTLRGTRKAMSVCGVRPGKG